MPLARPGKFDDSSGDDTVGELVNKAEGNTSPFERDPQNPLRFEIGIEVVEVSRDGHANPAEGHLMLDASDLLSARRQPAAVSGSLEQQTDILAKNNCNIISLMETINDTYAPPRSLNSEVDQWTDVSAPRRKGGSNYSMGCRELKLFGQRQGLGR